MTTAVRRRISVNVGGTATTAELDEDVSPVSCEAFWRALPIRTQLSHAKWSGHAAFFLPAPGSLAGIELESPVCSIYPGQIVATPGGSEILMSYGTAEYRTATGTNYVTRIAHIDSDLASFRKTLRAMHDSGDIEIVIERHV